ncbi:MAG: di-trans,poly-cis-decaprenylcistransferase [Nanoarchaeota archaeon]|nr:di-trans,poly-cis-decaprenylcistransferase [Nanoarchaeota archaeon]
MEVGPKHVGIILDGNRRYAKKHNLNPLSGHEHGIKIIHGLFDWAKELEIKEMSLYAFSTENFNRNKEEVEYLMNIFLEEFDNLLESDKLEKEQIRVRFIGRINLFDKKIKDKMEELMEKTKDYDKFAVNFCMAYGGRAEIVDSVNKLIKQGVKEIDEQMIFDNLYLKSEPDLIIRTSEQRLSNFLMWQGAYSEIIFLPNLLWPEFSKQDLADCVEEFKRRKRRYGE